MTAEQLKELAEVLSVCSAKSSVIKERDELRALMEENLSADEARRRNLYLVFSPPLLIEFDRTQSRRRRRS